MTRTDRALRVMRKLVRFEPVHRRELIVLFGYRVVWCVESPWCPPEFLATVGLGLATGNPLTDWWLLFDREPFRYWLTFRYIKDTDLALWDAVCSEQALTDEYVALPVTHDFAYSTGVIPFHIRRQWQDGT